MGTFVKKATNDDGTKPTVPIVTMTLLFYSTYLSSGLHLPQRFAPLIDNPDSCHIIFGFAIKVSNHLVGLLNPIIEPSADNVDNSRHVIYAIGALTEFITSIRNYLRSHKSSSIILKTMIRIALKPFALDVCRIPSRLWDNEFKELKTGVKRQSKAAAAEERRMISLYRSHHPAGGTGHGYIEMWLLASTDLLVDICRHCYSRSDMGDGAATGAASGGEETEAEEFTVDTIARELSSLFVHLGREFDKPRRRHLQLRLSLHLYHEDKSRKQTNGDSAVIGADGPPYDFALAGVRGGHHRSHHSTAIQLSPLAYLITALSSVTVSCDMTMLRDTIDLKSRGPKLSGGIASLDRAKMPTKYNALLGIPKRKGASSSYLSDIVENIQSSPPNDDSTVDDRIAVYNHLVRSYAVHGINQLRTAVNRGHVATMRLMRSILIQVIIGGGEQGERNEDDEAGSNHATNLSSSEMKHTKNFLRWNLNQLFMLSSSPQLGVLGLRMIGLTVSLCQKMLLQGDNAKSAGLDVSSREVLIGVLGDATSALRGVQCESADGDDQLPTFDEPSRPYRSSIYGVQSTRLHTPPPPAHLSLYKDCGTPSLDPLWSSQNPPGCLCGQTAGTDAVCTDCLSDVHSRCTLMDSNLGPNLTSTILDNGKTLTLCVRCSNARQILVRSSENVSQAIAIFANTCHPSCSISASASGSENESQVTMAELSRSVQNLHLSLAIQSEQRQLNHLAREAYTVDRSKLSVVFQDLLKLVSPYATEVQLIGDGSVSLLELIGSANSAVDQRLSECRIICPINVHHEVNEVLMPSSLLILQASLITLRLYYLEASLGNVDVEDIISCALPLRPSHPDRDEAPPSEVPSSTLKNWLVLHGVIHRWETRWKVEVSDSCCSDPFRMIPRSYPRESLTSMELVLPTKHYNDNIVSGQLFINSISKTEDQVAVQGTDLSSMWRLLSDTSICSMAHDIESTLLGLVSDPAVSVRRGVYSVFNGLVRQYPLFVSDHWNFWNTVATKMIEDPSALVKGVAAAIFVSVLNKCISDSNEDAARSVAPKRLKKTYTDRISTLLDELEDILPKPLKQILSGSSTTALRNEAIHASIQILKRPRRDNSPHNKTRTIFQSRLILTLLDLIALRDASVTEKVLNYLWTVWMNRALQAKKVPEDKSYSAVFSEVLTSYSHSVQAAGSIDPPLLVSLVAFGVQKGYVTAGDRKTASSRIKIEGVEVWRYARSHQGQIASHRFSKFMGLLLTDLLVNYRRVVLDQAELLLDPSKSTAERNSIKARIANYQAGQLSVLNSMRLVAELAPLPHNSLKQVETYLNEVTGDKCPSTVHVKMLEELTNITGLMVATLEASNKTEKLFDGLASHLVKIDATCRFNKISRWALKSIIIGNIRLKGKLKSTLLLWLKSKLIIVYALVTTWQRRIKLLEEREHDRKTGAILYAWTNESEIQSFGLIMARLCVMLETLDLTKSTRWESDDQHSDEVRVAVSNSTSPLSATPSSSPTRMSEMKTPVNELSPSTHARTPGRTLSARQVGQATPTAELLLSSECLKGLMDGIQSDTSLAHEELLDGDFLVAAVDNTLLVVHKKFEKLLPMIPSPTSLKEDSRISDGSRVDLTAALFHIMFEGCQLLSGLAFHTEVLPRRPAAETTGGPHRWSLRGVALTALEVVSHVMSGMEFVVCSHPDYMRSRRWTEGMSRLLSSSFHKASGDAPSSWDLLKAQEMLAPPYCIPLRTHYSSFVKAYYQNQLTGLHVVSSILCHFEQMHEGKGQEEEPAVRQKRTKSEEEEDDEQENCRVDSMTSKPDGVDVLKESTGQGIDFVSGHIGRSFDVQIFSIVKEPWFEPGSSESQSRECPASLKNFQESWAIVAPTYWSNEWRRFHGTRLESSGSQEVDVALEGDWKWINELTTSPPSPLMDKNGDFLMDQNEENLSPSKVRDEIIANNEMVMQIYLSALKVVTVMHRQGISHPTDTVNVCLLLCVVLSSYIVNSTASGSSDVSVVESQLESLMNQAIKQMLAGVQRGMIKSKFQESLLPGFVSSYALGVFDYHLRLMDKSLSKRCFSGTRIGFTSCISPLYCEGLYRRFFNVDRPTRLSFFSLLFKEINDVSMMDIHKVERGGSTAAASDAVAAGGEDLTLLERSVRRCYQYATSELTPSTTSDGGVHPITPLTRFLDLELAKMDLPPKLIEKITAIPSAAPQAASYSISGSSSCESLTVPPVFCVPLSLVQWLFELVISIRLSYSTEVIELLSVLSGTISCVNSQVDSILAPIESDTPHGNDPLTYALNVIISLAVNIAMVIAVVQVRDAILIAYPIEPEDANKVTSLSNGDVEVESDPRRPAKEVSPMWNVDGNEISARSPDWDVARWARETVFPLVETCHLLSGVIDRKEDHIWERIDETYTCLKEFVNQRLSHLQELSSIISEKKKGGEGGTKKKGKTLSAKLKMHSQANRYPTKQQNNGQQPQQRTTASARSAPMRVSNKRKEASRGNSSSLSDSDDSDY
eukprot:GHVH01002326.1.p1 GENE.GHVH01002326.1~~GHVH01002326.1.p1  ORF type:complete len:2741 (+),score=369.82 GHVH01002326.1:738-8225(+)